MKDLTPSFATTFHEIPGTAPNPPLRYFFVVMACLFPIVAVLGFTPSYLAVHSGQAQLHWFAHVHGAIMSTWLIVFITQTTLAAKGNFKFHRQLGFFSIGLGVLVWLCMGVASIRARIAYPSTVEDMGWDILLIEMSAMNLFGLFFVSGILLRKKTDAHKRLLFLATAVLLQAAIDRIRFLPGLQVAPFVRFIYLDALIVPLLVYDLITSKRIHKFTMIGGITVLVVQFAVAMTWGSPAWHQFWFNRFAPWVERVVEVTLSDAQIAPLLGRYGDENWKMTISHEGDKVYLTIPGTPKFEMGVISENELFLRAMYFRATFVKGADGRVMKIVIKQVNRAWEANRMN